MGWFSNTDTNKCTCGHVCKPRQATDTAADHLAYVADLRAAVERAQKVQELSDYANRVHNNPKATDIQVGIANVKKSLANGWHTSASRELTPRAHKIYLEIMSRTNKKRAEKNAK